MNEALNRESENLARSWMQHEASWLRDYLVAGVEDPRLNIQSILSRHFLVQLILGNQFEELIEQEIRFGAVMNWLRNVAGGDDEEIAAGILHALQRGADNVEGLAIPHFVLQTFTRLPITGRHQIPNYIESFLSGNVAIEARQQCLFNGVRPSSGAAMSEAGNGSECPKPTEVPQLASPGDGHTPLIYYRELVLDTFQNLWAEALRNAAQTCTQSSQSHSLLEPACGSANDYRFIQSYGLGSLFDYTGFDLCAKNITNAQTLFPRAHFAIGNVFEIAAPARSFDLCLVHDLFEHLSLEGLDVAVREVCRVTRQSICVGFFQMDEISEHVVRPLDEYYWNLLSARRMKSSFARQGFSAQIVHIGTFLRQQIGCDNTHNPNAYTFVLDRVG
jgi:hypothetical protein